MLCGALVMVVEVMGSRVIGPFYGVSLFVWTSLITVTLLALARLLGAREVRALAVETAQRVRSVQLARREIHRAGGLSAEHAFTHAARADGGRDGQPHCRAAQIRDRDRHGSRTEALS